MKAGVIDYQRFVNETIGYACGRFVTTSDIAISLGDLGFRQGVTAVERLRTYEFQLRAVDLHLSRWWETTEYLGITGLPNELELRRLCDQVLKRNQPIADVFGDVGMTWIATPGDPLVGHTDPTFLIYLNPLDHGLHRSRQESGQPLIITDVQQQPDETWSRQAKVRSRLHYYRADKLAKAYDAKASGVLVDHDGTVTETSISNLAIVRDGDIIAPPLGQVLHGVTQQLVQGVAARLGLTWHQAKLAPADLRSADEVLLMGTDTGLWFASHIDERPVGDANPGKVYQRLRDELGW